MIRKVVLTLIVSILFLDTKNRPAFAFNLVPPPSSEPTKLTFTDFQFQVPGVTDKISGYTESKILQKLSPPKDSTSDSKSIIAQLEDPANAWSGSMVFKPASQPLSSLAQFITREYHPCAPTSSCDISGGYPTITGAIGNAFTLSYFPSTFSGDPTAYSPGTSLQWIQRVTSTDTAPSTKYGRSKIDVLGNNPTVPFYAAASIDSDSLFEYVFRDRPERDKEGLYAALYGRKSFDWTAELYLATSRLNQTTGKYEVTLYDGIQWGWKTTLLDPKKPTPPPGSPSNAPAAPQAESVCNYVVHAIYSGVVYDGCDLVASNALEANPDMTGDAATNLHFIGDIQPSTQNAAGVPEPSPIAGAILAVGLWGGVTWQKKRRNKPIKP